MTTRWNSGWPTDDEGCTLINNDVVPPAEAYFNSGSMMDSTGMYTSGGVPPVDAPPVNVVAPVISGDTIEGSVLTSTSGTWSGYPVPTYHYQWYRGVTAIPYETSTYVTQAADVGQSMTCVVTATNTSGTAWEQSNAIIVTAGAGPTDGILLEDGSSFLLAENDDFIVQE